MPDPNHQVLGTHVSMPVQIRTARCFVAGFSASESAVRSAISARGDVELAPLRIRPGRTMCMLVFVDYVDGDLGPYNEFGVCFLVQDPERATPSPLAALGSLVRGDAHALIHQLPVDGEFTLAAGRGIWGFPKVLADFEVDHDSATKTGRVSQDGKLIADLEVRRGIGVPDSSSEAVLQSYAQLDGVTRRTPWRLTSTSGTRTRIGGASLRLGSHPMADELRRLKLSRHALMTSSVSDLAMTFEDAVVIE
ncbi:acetoacetate decarboxylase family protein [Gordonia sp. HY002]|uniref:acetoacetate decarboxylase family protein n=1 Tax=Gordonia zhenghanii TaxID=2911516 RepID=UPI001EF00DF9|nr:acetoacetate decarboxylase family protein [Gordonia zhenghanii]MCF8568737.1 acetoacetate decarboxylase family protein [Gordonia zhenghanii]MCF8607046.1 acetoacetate decarboxylase family protein [Gordonia zhenghanii]